MSDYLGLNQTRVLDSTNRNFESVVYQKQKPPLSSEVNLTGKIEAERSQNTVQAVLPSGWVTVGQIKNDLLPSQCRLGDVLCSSDCSSNSFYFVAQDLGKNTEKNIAWVNGWRIVVQGGASPSNADSGYTPWSNTTENCLITLPSPPVSGNRVDFVFLEVWRKLVGTNSNIYQYGNVDHPNPFTNDLIDPARGFETSLRIQVQYRVRVSTIDDMDLYPEGFGPSVCVQGPLSAPNTTCDHANFTQVPGDIGLWMAGSGDEVAQELLETVDGHTYAIPMFAVRRRSTETYDPRGHNNGNGTNLSDYIAGKASDRPDNLFNNWIVAEDFVDLRHHVNTGLNLKEICSEAFDALQLNSLGTHMGYSSIGEDTHGVKLVAIDSIAPSSTYANLNTWSTYIGRGNNYRRWFANASTSLESIRFVRTVNDKTAGTSGNPWTASDEVEINLNTLLFPVWAEIETGVSIYIHHGYTVATTDIRDGTHRIMTITLNSGTVLTTSENLIIELTISYDAGSSNGLSEVPKKFLEARKIETIGTNMLPIAMKDQDIRVRTGHYADAVDTTDYGLQYNMLQARGGSTTHQWNFGHQMVYHAKGAGNSIVQFPKDMSGYSILGVADIKVNGITVSNPTITHTTGVSPIYTVNLGSTVALGKDVEMTLYTGQKYFDANKQGRGIIDCYQMKEIPTDETTNSSRTVFTLSPGSDIIAIGSYKTDDGYCSVFVDGSRVVLATDNSSFPDATSIKFNSAPAAGTVITVPALVRTAIDSTEGYAFIYEYSSYQGLLNSVVTGSIEEVGPAITTTSGSKLIDNYSYNTGVIYYQGTTRVDGLGTGWTSLLDASTGLMNRDYYIQALSDPKIYKIASITSDTVLYIDTTADRASTGNESYYIITFDDPEILATNVIDRFPTSHSYNDASGNNWEIATIAGSGNAYPIVETKITSKVQDVIDVPPNTAQIGLNSADRGRRTIYLPNTKIGKSTLGLNYENLDSNPYNFYHKTYQSYILNKDNSGRLYLMVVGSESANTSVYCKFDPYTSDDSVDIFELPGRPIITNRNK
jgi:hypothetical protein